ncbi:unnamed protein product [Closterium sp. NIES-65]|nr:unnamed protein product [Closterium sp. NIES-65]
MMQMPGMAYEDERAKMIAFPAMPPPHMIMSAGNPFKRRPSPAMQSIPSADDPQEWNRTAGYYCEPHVGKEVYEFRPGATPISAVPEDSIPPSCLPDAFGSMGKTSRTVLEAIGRSLDLRSYTFTDLLDNVPLKANEISSSVLSVTCHGRRFANETMMDPAMDDKDPLLIPPEDAEARAEKGLVTLIKSDRPGLYIRDPQNQWLLADANLGPNDLILITGLTLYQATGGYVSPALYKTDLASASVGMQVPEGRASVFFRLLPRASSIIHCSAMAASGHAIAGPFQQPVAVQDFMLRQHPIDQIAAASYNGLLRPMGMGAAMPMVEPGSPNVRRRKKHRIMGSDGRSLAPSKRLRMEAQRVLKEKVQDLADAKGIKIRFCNLKECEEQHMAMEEPPCSYLRLQLGWPANVPFVHPHDLPNRAKQAFLEAYEPGWSERQLSEPMGIEVGTTPKRVQADTFMDPIGPDAKFSTRAVYEYLRTNNKPVPTGKPQVVGHKVDIPLLCRIAFAAGGKEQFEQINGFQRFIAETFHLDGATEKEKERALERLRKLYEQVLADYVETLVANHAMGMGGGGAGQHMGGGNSHPKASP